MAADLGIEHHIPENINNEKAGWAHQTAINWTWQNIARHNNDINIILDHDMFLIGDFSCVDMKEDLWGIPQSRQGLTKTINYFHPAFMVLNGRTLENKEAIDFVGDEIDGVRCDSGGNLYHYLEKYPDLKTKALSLIDISTTNGNLHLIPFQDYDPNTDTMQICDDHLLHFRNGSNWANNPKIGEKKKQLEAVIEPYIKK
jgi:hypothetical protein